MRPSILPVIMSLSRGLVGGVGMGSWLWFGGDGMPMLVGTLGVSPELEVGVVYAKGFGGSGNVGGGAC